MASFASGQIFGQRACGVFGVSIITPADKGLIQNRSVMRSAPIQ